MVTRIWDNVSACCWCWLPILDWLGPRTCTNRLRENVIVTASNSFSTMIFLPLTPIIIDCYFTSTVPRSEGLLSVIRNQWAVTTSWLFTDNCLLFTVHWFQNQQWHNLYSLSLPVSMSKFIRELKKLCKFLVIDEEIQFMNCHAK